MLDEVDRGHCLFGKEGREEAGSNNNSLEHVQDRHL